MNSTNELLELMNVGKAIYKDLQLLEVNPVEELATQDPDDLYARLEKITGFRQDPCVWDTFAAIIHEARTGIKQPWWEWTKVRKERQAQGTFVPKSI